MKKELFDSKHFVAVLAIITATLSASVYADNAKYEGVDSDGKPCSLSPRNYTGGFDIDVGGWSLGINATDDSAVCGYSQKGLSASATSYRSRSSDEVTSYRQLDITTDNHQEPTEYKVFVGDSSLSQTLACLNLKMGRGKTYECKQLKRI